MAEEEDPACPPGAGEEALRPAVDPRPYRVEAGLGPPDADPEGVDWRPLGGSPGGTRSFRVAVSDGRVVVAVRIRDASGRTLRPDGEPLRRPGTLLCGAGLTARP
jgi:hypothetical protein